MNKPTVKSLEGALATNQAAAEEVKAAAEELVLVRTVLESQLADAASADGEDVKLAVERTGDIGEQLDTVVEKLDQVNDVLQKAVQAPDAPAR